jgi:hypothetical protein
MFLLLVSSRQLCCFETRLTILLNSLDQLQCRAVREGALHEQVFQAPVVAMEFPHVSKLLLSKVQAIVFLD